MSFVADTIKRPPNLNASSSSSNPSQKLTKKQKKSLAFRERKTGKQSRDTKSTGNPSTNEDEDEYGLAEVDVNAIPAMEDEVLPGVAGGSVQVEGVLGEEKGKQGKAKRDKGDKSKGKRPNQDGAEAVGVAAQAGKGQKRKREADEAEVDGAGVGDGEKGRKRKKAAKKEEEDGEGEGERNRAKQKFILFVGNLKYTTSKEAIQRHFAACNPPPEIRLLTPKPKPGVPTKHKSKGCAFLEFPSKVGLQQALKLHQSMLDDRMINVELTAGGGGKSEARMNKVKERNKGLLSQRQKKVDIAGKSKKTADGLPSRPDRPQRYSTTSGLDEAPTTKKTWTVGDEEEETHRGGKKHVRGKKKSKTWGTGVNAIPVG
ncbi:hypothetical protein EST38_g3285 [Candolleomyces aberdarensis]|uniref:RRM domain-containing protein n=1 Tax=Candolleomyces aberdarensis TaxID=2316362 RepID=A0A4Q2DU04_9AGAR|nr:hypothetical protein EST38_g3285 [Candolleomyces aberdarensis]